jgi:hypothetical protein
MDAYISDRIASEAFCEAFYESYNLAMGHACLSETEQKVFDRLNTITSRYTSCREDLISYPGVYYNDEHLKQAVQGAKNELPFEFGLENSHQHIQIMKNATLLSSWKIIQLWI